MNFFVRHNLITLSTRLIKVESDNIFVKEIWKKQILIFRKPIKEELNLFGK